MTDNQEQISQHWQELAEQLGLEVPAAASPASSASKEEPASPAPASSKSEDREESVEDQGWKMQDREVEAKAGSMDESSPESGPNVEPTTEAPPEMREERPRPRGRRERGGDRSERSSRSRRSSAPRRREAEPIRDEASGDRFEEPESQEAGEFPEEVEPAILHDSSVMEREKEDDDVDDVDTLSDWNVPSWTELIESLYRPER